ncbi:MAG: hypothetical protein MK086_05465 [Flavobacteriales bacterium]|nr:hypothetical protein [Flavobacteriales bacterium]
MSSPGNFISEINDEAPLELKWNIKAKPGTNYRITVLEPISAVFSHVGLLDDSGCAIETKLFQIQF